MRLGRLHTDCTGYGFAARFFGLGGGTTSALPAFSSLRKNFWAWLLTCQANQSRISLMDPIVLDLTTLPFSRIQKTATLPASTLHMADRSRWHLLYTCRRNPEQPGNHTCPASPNGSSFSGDACSLAACQLHFKVRYGRPRASSYTYVTNGKGSSRATST